MANTNLSISIAKGNSGFKHNDFVIGTLAPSAGAVEVRIAADLSRIDTLLLLEAVERVLESNGVFTTDNAQ